MPPLKQALLRNIKIVLSCSLVCLIPACSNPRIHREEQVVFFPTAAYRSVDHDHWILPVHGWIFEPEQNSIKRRLLLDVLKDALDIEFGSKGEYFERRARKFLVDSQSGRAVGIKLSYYEFHVGTSASSGHFQGQFKLSDHQVAALLRDQASKQQLTFKALTDPQDKRKFPGTIDLVEVDGISVISDIDDTIKITNVTDKEKMLEATFLKKFKAVKGMSSVYRSWHRQGAQFHYVSGSPWQLYEELRDFMQRERFPDGAFDLRMADLSLRGGLQMASAPKKMKEQKISTILTRYPRRRFALIGDSGEVDAKIYGEMARRYPHQIAFIAIRMVDGGKSERRIRSALKGIPSDRILLFERASQLPRRLFRSLRSF